jgi:cell division protein FtsI (penicillin-binding protein 3)
VARRGARPAVRLFILLAAMTLSLTAVAGRLVHLQVVKAQSFEDLGAKQRVRRVELQAKRGSILDRNGVPLAMSVDARAIYANPQFVSDPAAAAAKIAPLLGVAPALIQERLARKVAFVYLARKVDVAAAEQVMQLGLPGIGALDEIKRVYPAGSLAAQVIGFVGTDNTGLAGLEAGWEKTLGGVPGEEIVEQDPRGRPIPQGKSHTRLPERGEDLILTIDRDIQFAAEQALGQALTKTGAHSGSAVVLDPRTGDVLAMANWPALDPTAFATASPEVRRNRAVQDAYEPGSVNKVVTAAAAIEGRLADPAEILRVPDHLHVADKTFHDFAPHPVLNITYAEALARSSNVGTIEVALRVGPNRLFNMLHAFGLGQRTGIGFPGESSGILAPVKDWSGTSIGTIPIGQGIAVTPLQVAQVYATIANDGVAVHPRLVRAVIDRNGHRVDEPAPERHRVISVYTAAQLRAMLIGVVEEGTGRPAGIPGYLVAGKTGTARKPLANARGYSNDVETTFVGMVPADSPRFVLVVQLDAPFTHTSAATAAPVFKELAGFVISRMRIPPIVGPLVPAPASLAAVRARP